MIFADVQRLRAFALVLDLGSISAAADVLGYTQSAVSQQLAALEREAGMALVDRSQRPLRATGAGAILRPHVERVLAALAGAEAAIEEARARRSPPPGRLPQRPFVVRSRGGARPAARHPELIVRVVQLETTRRSSISAGVRSISLSFITYPESRSRRRAASRVDACSSTTSTWSCPMATGSRAREAVSIADLRAEPLILPRRDTPAGRFRSLVEQLCGEAGFAPKVAYELDDLPAAQAFVAAGIALVPMHGLTLTTVPPGATSRPLAERPSGSRTIEAVAPAATRTPLVDDLVGLLAESASAHAARRRGGTEVSGAALRNRRDEQA